MHRTIKLLIIPAAAAAALLTVAACGGPTSAVTTPEAEATAAEGPVEGGSESTPKPKPKPKPVVHKLTKADYTLTVKILDKTCYGSGMGANVEYRVKPKYVGPGPTPKRLIELTYVVKGDDAGNQTGTITLENGKFEAYEGEGFASTRSCSTPITAKVKSLETFED